MMSDRRTARTARLPQILSDFRGKPLQIAFINAQLLRHPFDQLDGETLPLAWRIRSPTGIFNAFNFSARSANVRIFRAQFSPMVTLKA
jgi:hypothetical protein